MSRLFKDYSYTEQEVLTTLSDAISIIDGIDYTVSERLADIIIILKRLWNIEEV